MTTIEPVRKDVWVPATPDEAFRRFTDGIDRWWPKATHSVGMERCRDVRFEETEGGRRLVEETDDGSVHAWGDVSVWEPGERLVFAWHPGRDPAGAQEVEVTFEAAERDGTAGTSVALVHRGWEALGEGAAETRDQYEQGWDPVLGGYAGTFAA